MDKKICKECATENEVDLRFCKNCGAEIGNKEHNVKNQYNEGYDNFNYNTKGKSFNLDSIDGVPTNQMAIFIGKKSGYYCDKFGEMIITASKTSWNWAVAVLGFLFGPFGAAFWCFYRKMYKVAILLVIIGVLLTGVKTVLTYDTTSNAMNAIFSLSGEENLEEFSQVLSDIEVSKNVLNDTIANVVNTVVNFATAIFMGLLANFLYKNHCVKSIKKYRKSGLDQRYYELGIASVGGTSGGMLALGVLIKIIIENLASSLVFIINIT